MAVREMVEEVLQHLTMTNKEKIQMIQHTMANPRHIESQHYELLEKIGDMKYQYYKYMTTAPINCDKELERLADADYDLCTALLTMLLREDHFSNGSFERRYKNGSVNAILNKMIELLNNQIGEN